MSRYHVIDAGEGFSSPSSNFSSSPRLEHYSTDLPRLKSGNKLGRGDPLFPDVDMHLGMIFGMNSANGPKSLAENGQIDERIHMRLKFLEDSNTVMQSRNQNLITENKALSNQLEEEGKTIEKLKSRLQETRDELENEKSGSKEKKNTKIESKDQMISTVNLTPPKIEKSAQCWAVCLACQRKLEGNETPEPTVIITKSELESLERDMQALRDAVVTREEAWDRAMEREENYRQQLARLSAETVTARHVLDSRHSELEALAVTLAEKEAELKATQKDLLSLKKIVVKMERRQRHLEETLDLASNCAESNSNVMSEKEQKTVEEVVRRQLQMPLKLNKQLRPRPKGSSSMPQSLQSSPRSPRITN